MIPISCDKNNVMNYFRNDLIISGRDDVKEELKYAVKGDQKDDARRNATNDIIIDVIYHKKISKWNTRERIIQKESDVSRIAKRGDVINQSREYPDRKRIKIKKAETMVRKNEGETGEPLVKSSQNRRHRGFKAKKQDYLP